MDAADGQKSGSKRAWSFQGPTGQYLFHSRQRLRVVQDVQWISPEIAIRNSTVDGIPKWMILLAVKCQQDEDITIIEAFRKDGEIRGHSWTKPQNSPDSKRMRRNDGKNNLSFELLDRKKPKLTSYRNWITMASKRNDLAISHSQVYTLSGDKATWIKMICNVLQISIS